MSTEKPSHPFGIPVDNGSDVMPATSVVYGQPMVSGGGMPTPAQPFAGSALRAPRIVEVTTQRVTCNPRDVPLSLLGPAPEGKPIGGPTGFSWTDGLCSWDTHLDECCDTCVCWHCKLGWISYRLDHNTADFSPEFCCGVCLADVCCPGVASAIAVCSLRGKVTQRYSIEEQTCQMCAKSCCCAPCAVCQISREMQYRWEHPSGTVCSKAPPPTNQTMAAVISTTTTQTYFRQ